MRLLLLSFVLLASTMVNAQSFRVGPTVRALYTSPTYDARSGWRAFPLPHDASGL